MARLKSDFVANVSHDLKTPLSVIRMFGETLDMGRITDEQGRREYYRVIARESERLSRLIDNVLDFSRIEGGRQTYRMAPTAIEPLIRSVLEAFDYPLAQHGFKVDVDVAPNLPEVPVDADAVAQALANLVDNAIKYSGGERALTAVALLFAMLEVRPVPFCVLDEVDAALDEANVGRFSQALRSLADRTQFVVITHNRGTIEAADALYGVTVGDDSVSRVISLRLDEARAIVDRQRGERLASGNGNGQHAEPTTDELAEVG